MKNNTLERFVKAQNSDFEGYAQALSEIKAGCKRGHWIWYIFPQLKGLGTSCMSEFYGIADKEETIAYYQHDVLGKRLKEITSALLQLENSDIQEIMGYPDNLKLRSCMTLFYEVTEDTLFLEVIKKFYNGKKDNLTLNLLTGKDSIM